MSVDLNKGATVELVKALSDDIRQGADGTVYSSAGDAVRNQILELKSAFNKELYNEPIVPETVSNERVKSTTGEIEEATNFKRTVYIDVSCCQSIKLEWNAQDHGVNPPNALCFYSDNKTYISGIASPLSVSSNSNTIDIPSTAHYAIYSGANTPMSKISVTLVDVVSPIREIWTAVDKKIERTTVFGRQFTDENVLLQNVIGVNKFPNNLIVNSECENNAYVAVASGTIVYNSPNYFCTGFIPITAGGTYRSNVGRNYAWYASDKSFLSGMNDTQIQSGITAPENAAYIRFTINKTTDGIDNPVYLYFANILNYNAGVIIPDLVVESTRPWCYGKKINWIGDSIVDGQDFDEIVCDAMGIIKASEYGINGSTIALAEDGTDTRNAICERYDNMSNDADIIAVSAGTNDFEYAWCPIGTIDDADDGTSNTTFYGALKALCRGLIEKYPHKVIFFTTPIKRMQPFVNGDGGEYTPDYVDTTPFSKNKYGKTLGDYADIIKEVCGYYSIPVLDMNREALLNPHIEEQQDCFTKEQNTYYPTSFYYYTHPNATGQKIMARRVCGWLTQLGYNIE